ncbi:histidine kinase [Bacillus manliponensis]|uniref:histidine kinase n=1 Tax=Bacillus manliponensis TaxID=574376 RepID=A0A073K2K4_9BACI|nr:GAF domain-containing sensor histidine kinase [Bacillus manliponensis]KEK21534.1 histidine kinase [Bacillus manliponensis]
MFRESRTNELIILKEIAETLNASNDTYGVLEAVLKKLLQVTGLTTGWIFLADEEGRYTKIIDYNLPPALSFQNKKPMCEGECWCLRRFVDGKLERAVNIIECKRIVTAIEQNWGDTNGILHHATVPLKAGNEEFGLLNVAKPEKNHFNEEELALLQSVALQIGTALKRAKLYESEQKRASYYVKLEQVIQHIGKMQTRSELLVEAVKQVGIVFSWPSVTFFIRQNKKVTIHTSYEKGMLHEESRTISKQQLQVIQAVINEGKSIHVTHDEVVGEASFYKSAAAVPIFIQNQIFGVLFVSSVRKYEFDHHDMDILQVIAEHISLALENIRLNEQHHELARMEERNRLARDLHDSVCQKLFSLTLMARGIEALVGKSNGEVGESLHDMQQLTKEALQEMRTLIWQLRPAGLENGLLLALKQYGEGLGLKILQHVEGVVDLPRAVEESLWRIGQEAFNNVTKHANVREVAVYMKVTKRGVTMNIVDYGQGFDILPVKKGTLGMTTMHERAQMLGGHVTIVSQPGETNVKVTVPL